MKRALLVAIAASAIVGGQLAITSAVADASVHVNAHASARASLVEETSSAACQSPTSGHYKVGLLYVSTGPLGPEFQYALPGATARFDYAAAHGGPKVTVDAGNTAGTPTANLQQAQRMVSNGDIAVMEDTIATSGSASFLHSKGVPVVGFALTPAWTTDHNMFGWDGAPSFGTSTLVSQPAKFLAQRGGTKLVIVGIGGNQASQVTAEKLVQEFKHEGGKSAIITNITFGQQQFAANIQKIKSSSPNAVLFDTTAGSGLAYYQQATAAGIHFKVALEENGYGPTTLKTYHSKVGGVYFSDGFAPLELTRNPAVKTFTSAMKKYEPKVADTNQHAQYGWVMATLILRMFTDSGKCVTQAGMISGLTKDKTWNADGFGSTATFASRPAKTTCSFYTQVNAAGTRFIPLYNGKPQCSTKIG